MQKFNFCSFHISGNVLVVILKLQIEVRLSEIKRAASFKSLGSISSDPVNFYTSKLFRWFSTLSLLKRGI